LLSTLRASGISGVSKCRTAWQRPDRRLHCSWPNAMVATGEGSIAKPVAGAPRRSYVGRGCVIGKKVQDYDRKGAYSMDRGGIVALGGRNIHAGSAYCRRPGRRRQAGARTRFRAKRNGFISTPAHLSICHRHNTHPTMKATCLLTPNMHRSTSCWTRCLQGLHSDTSWIELQWNLNALQHTLDTKDH